MIGICSRAQTACAAHSWRSRASTGISGLRSCSTYYADRANGLPEGVFAASKGFSYGWMDLSGRWLYAESIFASSNDEMDNGFF